MATGYEPKLFRGPRLVTEAAQSRQTKADVKVKIKQLVWVFVFAANKKQQRALRWCTQTSQTG